MPREVWEMDMREVNDLMAAWIDNPPPHVALIQLRDVVITGLGGKPPARGATAKKSSGLTVGGQATTPEQFAAMFGVKLGAD